MKTLHGWSGNILFIDLSTTTTHVETIDDHMAYIGGRGINQWLLFDLMEKNTHPLDPGNLLILGSGPMVGTPIPCANRLSVEHKNVITGGVGSGNCGGRFAIEMKRAGYDHIVISGRAETPTYLYIDSGKVYFRDASDLLGRDTWETEVAIQQKENAPSLSTLVIGPAGERRVAFSAIIADKGRAVGYGGGGAVMGSKNLKAIAVKGNRSPVVAHPERLMENVKRFRNHVLEKSSLVKAYRKGGTLGAYLIPGENRPHGVRNLNEAFWSQDAILQVARDKFDQYRIRKHGCANCPVWCSAIFEVDDMITEGIQANSLRAFGSNMDVASAKDILYAHGLCNGLGLDVDQTSAAVAWAIDCFEQGLLTLKDTDGLPLRFGDGECVSLLIRKIAFREGIGDILARGVFEASQAIGRGSEKLAAVVKKNGVMEAAMRSHKAWALGIVTSTKGTGHLRGAPGLEFQKLPPEESLKLLGIEDISDPTSYENKAALVIWQEKYKAVIDAMGLCALVTMWMDRTLFTPGDIADFFEDVTGRKTSPAELLEAGERIQNLERAYNLLHAGFGRSDDMPPAKFVDIPVNNGVFKGEALDIDKWNIMLDEYYRLRHWDIQTGWPTRKCLSDLGLDAVSDKLRNAGIDLA